MGRAPRRRVLVVDDHKDSVELLADLLHRRGFHVVAAESPEAALVVASEMPFDVVVLDYAMPRMTGYDLADRLTTLGCPPKYVFVSGMELPPERPAGTFGV